MFLQQSTCRPDRPAHAHNPSVHVPTVLAVAAMCDTSVCIKRIVVLQHFGLYQASDTAQIAALLQLFDSGLRLTHPILIHGLG